MSFHPTLMVPAHGVSISTWLSSTRRIFTLARPPLFRRRSPLRMPRGEQRLTYIMMANNRHKDVARCDGGFVKEAHT